MLINVKLQVSLFFVECITSTNFVFWVFFFFYSHPVSSFFLGKGQNDLSGIESQYRGQGTCLAHMT